MQGEASVGEMIRFSWRKSREILFPFNFKRWLKILIIVSLAGAGVQGCSANFRAPVKPAKPKTVMGKTLPAASVSVTSTSGSTASVSGGTETLPQTGTVVPSANLDQASGAKAGVSANPVKNPWSLWLVVGGALLGISFAIFFMWLSCRFIFILLDTIVTGNTAIRGPFREHREIGNSYFKWSLAFFGILLGAVLILGVLGIVLFGVVKGHIGWIILAGILAGLLLLAFFLGMMVIAATMENLVLPIMYREKIPAMSALNQFLEIETFAFGKVFQYLLVIFGLGIVASIAQGLVSILMGLAGLVAGGIVIIPGIFLVQALPLLKFPLIILGAFVVIAILLAVIVGIGMVMLPVAIFFRAFALAYLTRLYPACDLLEFSGKAP